MIRPRAGRLAAGENECNIALVLHSLEDGLAIQRAITPEAVPADAIVSATELVLYGAHTARGE